MSKMTENIEDYFRQFIPKRNSIFLDLEQEAKKEEIPIIGPVVGELLNILATAMNAKRILELGTAIGYSTLYLASACKKTGGKVTTVEVNQALANRAYNHINGAGLQNYAEIIVGDAATTMKGLNGTYDFIFIDIDKEYYVDVFEECHRIIRQNGLLMVDNTGFKDVNLFNAMISNSPGWRSANIFSFLPLHSPEKDGLCFGIKI